MLVLVGIGLVAGFVTAISPCVLPVLPILLAGGASGRKPLRIVTGLVASFVVFTLFASWLLDKLGLPQDFLRNLAIALLFLVAATLLVPRFGAWLERPFVRLTRFRAGGGGFLLGVSLGLVFVPCAGPVLAAITVVAANNDVGWRALVLTIAYAVGAAVPMLLIALGGRGIATRLREQGERLRVASGVVIGAVALGIALNADARFQTALPGYTQALQKHIEDSKTAQHQLAKLRGGKQVAASPPGVLQNYGRAPNFEPDGDWFNSTPLTVASHVHAAIKRLGISYPVVQDNKYRTWSAYGNQYWPAEYLIDRSGEVRHIQFGEGDYDQTEGAIRTLLGVSNGGMTHVADTTPRDLTTPESYLGYRRLQRYAGSSIIRDRSALYRLPKAL